MILDNVIVEAVTKEARENKQGELAYGYKINGEWYNHVTEDAQPAVSRGDIVKLDLDNYRNINKIKVTGKGEPPKSAPRLDSTGKPAGKTYSKPFTKGAGGGFGKKSPADVVSMALSTALKCAADISIATGDTANVKALAIELATMIVHAHGEEALSLVKASSVATSSVAKPAPATVSKSVEKRVAVQKVVAVDDDADFDEEIPF